MPRRRSTTMTSPTPRSDTPPPGSSMPDARVTDRTPPGVEAETATAAERLHPPAEMPADAAPEETPEQAAERAKWEQRRTAARAQVDRLLERYHTHKVPLSYPGAVDMARELVVMALSMEDRPCPHCGASTGPRLPREEAEARELETQAALLTRSFGEMLQREEERRLHERRAAHPLPTKGTHSGNANPAKGVKRAPSPASPATASRQRPNRSGAPLAPPTPIFSRRPPPGTAMPAGAGGAGGAGASGAGGSVAANPALARAIARQA